MAPKRSRARLPGRFAFDCRVHATRDAVEREIDHRGGEQRQQLRQQQPGALPSWRSASSAKSIIMIAFFFTMPISRMMPMIAMMPRSLPEIINASSAPTAAEGSVDRIVIGWMKLSYSTPSTMYIVTIAATISSTVLVSDAWKASAAPWKFVAIDAGIPISDSIALIAVTAW